MFEKSAGFSSMVLLLDGSSVVTVNPCAIPYIVIIIP